MSPLTHVTIPSEQAYQGALFQEPDKPLHERLSFGFVIFSARISHFLRDRIFIVKAIKKQWGFNNMAWQKGETGNSNGRPAGSGKAQIVRRIVTDVFGDENGAIKVVAELAKEGDLQACSLLLSKTIPPLRSSHEAVALVDGDALGAMTPSQRAALINEAGLSAF